MAPSSTACSARVQARQKAQHRKQLAKEADEASWEGPEGFVGGRWVSVGEAGGMDNLDLALNDTPAAGETPWNLMIPPLYQQSQCSNITETLVVRAAGGLAGLLAISASSSASAVLVPLGICSNQVQHAPSCAATAVLHLNRHPPDLPKLKSDFKDVAGQNFPGTSHLPIPSHVAPMQATGQVDPNLAEGNILVKLSDTRNQLVGDEMGIPAGIWTPSILPNEPIPCSAIKDTRDAGVAIFKLDLSKSSAFHLGKPVQPMQLGNCHPFVPDLLDC